MTCERCASLLNEALEYTLSELDTAHRAHTMSIGRDPDKYSSRFSVAIDTIRKLIDENQSNFMMGTRI